MSPQSPSSGSPLAPAADSRSTTSTRHPRSSRPKIRSATGIGDGGALAHANVLIDAHHEDSPEHDRYAAWLRALTASSAPFALSGVVLAGFLRIVKNRRIFDPRTPRDTAIRFCQQLVARLRAILIGPGRRHRDIFVRLCGRIEGPLVTAAYLAAPAIERGCELVTTDSDDARFPELR